MPADAPPSGEHRLQRWVALVGAVSALTGSLIGAGSAYLVARTSAGTEMAEARREERREAYARYYGDAAEYVARVGNASVQIQAALSKRPADAAAVAAAQKSLATALPTLFRDQAYVVLSGPPEVFNAAFDLNVVIARVQRRLTSEALRAEEIVPLLNELAEALSHFGDKAKEDLDGG